MSPLYTTIAEHFFSVFTFLLTLLFISFVLRSKKPPGSTVAWLFFIVVIPYIGIPLYLLMTNRKLPFVKQVEKSTLESTMLCTDQKTQLITSGEETYENILDMIESAKKSILITTFILGKDAVGKALVSALSKKAKAGIKVYLILDAFGGNFFNRPSLKILKNNGGHIAYFNPVFASFFRSKNANTRNHRKMLIIDGYTALIGGMNLAKEYIGPTPYQKRWKDLALKIEGCAVKDFLNIFHKDWLYASDIPIDIPYSENTLDAGSDELLVLASGPDAKEDTIYDTYISMMFKAKKRIWISTPYFIPDEVLTKTLELASKRGVDVQLLIPKKSNHQLADMARGTYLRQLEESGCKISLYPKMIHAKASLIDDTVIIGSANFDMRSLFLNYEICALCNSKQTTQALENWFIKLKTKSFRSDIKKIGFVKEMIEGIARVLGPLV